MNTTATQTPLNKIQTEEIVERLALEETGRNIAKDYNKSESTISLLKTANKQRIEAMQQAIVQENMDNLQETIKIDIDNNLEISRDYKHKQYDPNATAYKALVTKSIINPMLSKIGVFPSPANQYNFTQNNTTNKNNINQKVLQMFASGANDLLNTGSDMGDNELIEVSNGSDNE